MYRGAHIHGWGQGGRNWRYIDSLRNRYNNLPESITKLGQALVRTGLKEGYNYLDRQQRAKNITKGVEDFRYHLKAARGYFTKQQQRIHDYIYHRPTSTALTVYQPRPVSTSMSLTPGSHAWYDHWHNKGYGKDIGHRRIGSGLTKGSGRHFGQQYKGTYRMPYGYHNRGATGARHYRRRSGFYRRGGTLPFRRRGRGRIHREYKFLDITHASNTIGSAGEIYADTLCDIPQGAGASDRVGYKCYLKSIHLQGFIKYTPSQANQVDRLRVIVYIDTQTNGATATVLDLLESATIDSFRNLLNGNVSNSSQTKPSSSMQQT